MNHVRKNTMDLLNLLDEQLKDLAREEAQVLDEIVRVRNNLQKLRAKMRGHSPMDRIDFTVYPDDE